MMRPARPDRQTALHAAVALAILLVVVPFVVYAVPSVVGAESSYVVVSGSMQPTMQPGDVVVMDDLDPDAVREGDVVAFQRPGRDQPTTHRVVDVRRSDGSLAFQTKGDANEDPDARLVRAEHLVGRLVTVQGHPLVIPYVGHVVQFARTSAGFLALVVVPLALLVANEARGLLRSTRSATGGPGEPASEDSAPGEDENDSTTDSAAVTVTRTDLTLTLPVLAAFCAYSAWTAYADPSALSIAVTVATGGTLLVCGGLFHVTGDQSNPPAPNDTDSKGGTTATQSGGHQ